MPASFADVLRQHRLSAGLTQEALAEQAQLSVNGIQKLESGGSRPYRETVRRLVLALRLSPEDVVVFQAAAQPAPRPRRGSDARSSAGIRQSLPWPLTSFLGRDEEMDEVHRLLGTVRLLTVTGAGGVGKTRLAIEAARQQGARFSHGVHFLSLAGVGSPRLLPAAIAAAVGVSFYGSAEPGVQLVGALRDRHLLLVLDNFEHLLDGTSLLTDILIGAPGVTILVTSRERLNLTEEWVLSIAGLRFPDGQPANEPIDQYPAVELFVQRARQVQAGFAFRENVQPVLDICRRVEGMPLALELAATWLRVMPCDQITLQIDRSLDFLTTPLRNVPERHRSLRAVFDRSWSLLTDVERTLLAQLSVFRGGFDLGAAEQVAAASLSLLAGLIDKSLIRPRRTGRYDLHELVRQYLLERLAESSDASGAACRHFDFYARLAADAENHLYGPDQEVWFDRLEIEHDNLASALDWSLSEGHAEDGLRLAAALGFFWDLRTHFHEGYAWFRKLLDSDRRAPASVRIKALSLAGVFASYVGRRIEAADLCEEALARARDAGDQLNIAWSLTNLSLTHPTRTSDDLSLAVAWLEEALELFRAMDDGWGTSHSLRRLGWALTVAGEFERAASFLEEALTHARSAQDNSATAWSLFLLGKVVWLLKRDAQRAVGLHEQSLCLARQTRNIQLTQQVLFMLGQIAYTQKNYIEARSRYDQVVALALEQGGAAYQGFLLRPIVLGFAQLAVAGGEPEQAAKLLGAAHEVLTTNHHIFADRIDLEQDITTVRDQLGEARFVAGFADGRELSIAEAISYAREGRVRQRNSR